jgi:23S rRNA pseudouridine2605 synthase
MNRSDLNKTDGKNSSDTKNSVRITKYLAEAGECARRGAEEIINEGKVRINGIIVKELNAQVVLGRDHVQVGNRTVKLPPKGVILLHKPRGVVSTLDDPEGRKSISDYLTKDQASYFPVGRLDYDSSGLLILTNDGDLANRLMHPKFGFERVYEVRVRGSVTEKTLRRLTTGLKIDDDSYVKAKSIIVTETLDNETSATITVGEGKNRMVRKMFDACGHPVMRLKRIKHGPISLGSLLGGQIRKLTETEYKNLRKKVFEEKDSKTSNLGQAKTTKLTDKKSFGGDSRKYSFANKKNKVKKRTHKPGARKRIRD